MNLSSSINKNVYPFEASTFGNFYNLKSFKTQEERVADTGARIELDTEVGYWSWKLKLETLEVRIEVKIEALKLELPNWRASPN